MGGRKRTFANCYIANVGHHKPWTPNNLSTRISSNGGRYQQKVTNETTHLIVTQKAWRSQGTVIKDALDRGINIVSFDWLEDSWNTGSKKNETPYMWKYLESNRSESKVNDGPKKVQKKANGKQTKEVEGPKSHVGMMAEVFQESTDKFVDAKEKKRIDKQVESVRRVRAEMEKEEREAKEKENRDAKTAAAFKTGAKKAKNEIFSENHHVYTDSTGFKYEVTLTKVDTRHNRNERWVLTIYESNAEPCTYAVNAHFAKTAERPENHVIALMGSTFPTAFRTFKNEFKKLTEIAWEDRISFAIERNKREKRDRGQGTGSDTGTQRGVPVSENGATKDQTTKDDDFSKAPFQYHPPAFGPRGTLPERDMEKIAEVGPETGPDNTIDKSTQNEKVDRWMDGHNGPNSQPKIVDMTFASESGNCEAVDTAFIEDMDKILGDVKKPGNTIVPANTRNDEGYGDGNEIEEAYDYPFDNNELFVPDVATNQNDPTQQISFDTIPGLGDSFEPGSQLVGETQLAERAQGEFMEYLDNPNIAFQSSILGKRKISPVQATEKRTKTQKVGDMDESFGGESYFLGSSFTYDHGEGDMPTSLLNETAEVANDQLPVEAQMAADEATQID